MKISTNVWKVWMIIAFITSTLDWGIYIPFILITGLCNWSALSQSILWALIGIYCLFRYNKSKKQLEKNEK